MPLKRSKRCSHADDTATTTFTTALKLRSRRSTGKAVELVKIGGNVQPFTLQGEVLRELMLFHRMRAHHARALLAMQLRMHDVAPLQPPRAPRRMHCPCKFTTCTDDRPHHLCWYSARRCLRLSQGMLKHQKYHRCRPPPLVLSTSAFSRDTKRPTCSLATCYPCGVGRCVNELPIAVRPTKAKS